MISDILTISRSRSFYGLPTSAKWNYYINNNLVTELTIPSSVTSIGSNAFYNAKGITSITLSSSLKNIDYQAFFNCTGITSVTLPSSLTSINSSAFSGCTNIKTINIKISDYPNISDDRISYDALPSYAKWNYYINNNLVTELTIPSSVTSIGKCAFYNANGITSITLPSSLTSIGNSAFTGCTGRITVNCNIPDATPFYNAKFSEVVLSKDVSSIGKKVFCNCYGKLVVNCNIPSFNSSSSSPFYDSKFSKLVLNENVTSVGNYAFYNCYSIKSITLPSSMTNIGDYAFYCCNPTSFICKATTPPALGNNNVFSSYNGTWKIYVPYANLDAYKEKWSQLAEPTYTYLPLLDMTFFEKQTAESYAEELNGKDQSGITSVAFYEGGIDGTLTETVLKNGMNPNCLYYMPASAGLSGDNIVSLDNFEAKSVILTDNYSYDCPIPFRAKEIKYVHNPSVWANGSAGWETICLPFEPVSFKASERGYISPIMLGSTGNFWLRKFVGASSDAVYFTSTLDGRMEANTPYLVAFPGSTMGTGHLEGQTITFQGHDADIAVTRQPEVQKNDFVFVGNYDTTADGIEGWALNAVGNSFTKNSNVGNQPFRAYFKNLSGDASSSRLRISFSDPTDIRSLEVPAKDFTVTASSNGTLMIMSDSNRSLNIYSIDGRLERRVELSIGENRIEGLHRGLYIVENQKVNVR